MWPIATCQPRLRLNVVVSVLPLTSEPAAELRTKLIPCLLQPFDRAGGVIRTGSNGVMTGEERVQGMGCSPTGSNGVMKGKKREEGLNCNNERLRLR